MKMRRVNYYTPRDEALSLAQMADVGLDFDDDIGAAAETDKSSGGGVFLFFTAVLLCAAMLFVAPPVFGLGLFIGAIYAGVMVLVFWKGEV